MACISRLADFEVVRSGSRVRLMCSVLNEPGTVMSQLQVGSRCSIEWTQPGARTRLDHVDVAGEQRQRARGRVGDVEAFDIGDLRLLAPVILVTASAYMPDSVSNFTIS